MGFKIEQWTRRECIGLAALALFLLGLYLGSMSPAFPANDSPETISAAWELGIQHPPGYPLHTLLGRLAILMLPWGSPAWRMSCFSAALAVLCALVAAGISKILSPKSGAIVFITSFSALGLWRMLWEEATEAKGGIYLLNLLLCLGLLAVFFEFLKRGSKRSLRIFVLLSGLAMANHYMSAILFILPMGAWILWKRRSAIRYLVWMLPGLSLYLVLPLRAQFAPFNNLGNPSTWSGFLWVLLRQGYTQAGLSGGEAIAADQTRLWALHSLSFGAYWVAPLALIGLVWLWKSRPVEARWIILLYGLTFVSVVLINRTAADVRWLADIFILPAQALLAPCAGLGISVVWQQWLSQPFGPLLAIGLSASTAAIQFQGLDRSSDFTAFDYGANMMDSLPPHSLYAADGDYHYMPLIYQQQILGRRPDVVIAIATLLGQATYQDQLLKRSGLKAQGSSSQSAIISLLSQTPLSLSPYHPSIDEASLAPYKLWQVGLAQRAAVTAPKQKIGAESWAIRDDPRIGGEALQRSLLPWYAVSLVNAGNQRSGEGDFLGAAEDYRMASLMPGNKPEAQILFNLGSALEEAHQQGPALEAYQHSLALDPSLQASQQRIDAINASSQVWRGDLSKADQYAAEGDSRHAIPLYEQALSHGLENAGIWRNIAILHYRDGEIVAADQAFAKAISLSPNDPLLYKYRVMTLEKLATPAQLKAFVELGVQRSGDPDLKALLEKLKP